MQARQHVWVREETKENERRTPLTPHTARILIENGFTVTIERSSQRVFTDREYEIEGTGSDCSYLSTLHPAYIFCIAGPQAARWLMVVRGKMPLPLPLFWPFRVFPVKIKLRYNTNTSVLVMRTISSQDGENFCRVSWKVVDPC
jgi:hypothetical protein